MELRDCAFFPVNSRMTLSSLVTCASIGSQLYKEVQSLHLNIERMNREIFDDYRMQGWLSDFNVRHNYTQLWYLEPMQSIVRTHLDALQSSENAIR